MVLSGVLTGQGPVFYLIIVFRLYFDLGSRRPRTCLTKGGKNSVHLSRTKCYNLEDRSFVVTPCVHGESGRIESRTVVLIRGPRATDNDGRCGTVLQLVLELFFTVKNSRRVHCT